MPTWKEIKSSIVSAAHTAKDKTVELTKTASLKLKISDKNSKREKEFQNLGKLVYRKLRAKPDENLEKITIKTQETLEIIDNLTKEIRELKKQLKDLEEAEKTSVEVDVNEGNGEVERDEIIMAEFDEAYAKAKESSVEAKAMADDAAKEAEKAKEAAEELNK